MTLTEQMKQIMDGPRGGVMAIPGRERAYWVKGSNTVDEVRLAAPDAEEDDTCECPGWGHRGRCFHLRVATAQWQRDRPKLNDYMDDETLKRMFA